MPHQAFLAGFGSGVSASEVSVDCAVSAAGAAAFLAERFRVVTTALVGSGGWNSGTATGGGAARVGSSAAGAPAASAPVHLPAVNNLVADFIKAGWSVNP